MIIHLPPDALRPLLAGKVVSRHGLPVSGVSVGVIASKSKNIGTESYINGVKTRSDSNGRFELHDVSRRGLKLLVERNGLTTDVINVPDDADSANARLEVTLTYRVKMQQRAGLEVEWLEFVDLAGRVINAEVKYRDAISQDKRFSSYYFETGVFIVPEDAVAVVVYRGKAELERVPLVLNAGELNVVRL